MPTHRRAPLLRWIAAPVAAGALLSTLHAHAIAPIQVPPQATPSAPPAAAPTARAATVSERETLTAEVDRARADAKREFATESAAIAAYARLQRIRTPLLTAEDPRAAIWLADAAEDALLLGLAADGSGLACVAGTPTPDQREAAIAILRSALAWTQQAERAARETIASGQTTPELLARLDATELARRIPLLRASSAVMAAWAGALPDADATAILESASLRLGTLRKYLSGGSVSLADLSLGLASARLGRRAEAEAVLAPIAAARDAPEGSRTLAMIGLAESAAPDAAGRRRALTALRQRYGSELGESALFLLGDADFCYARAAMADAASPAGNEPPPYRGWLDAVASVPAARRAGTRQEALDRIARNAEGMDDAVVRVARALVEARTAGTRAHAADALRAALASPGLDAQVRTVAMLELGRTELLLGRPVEGALALLEFAQANPAEPVSRHAIDAAVAAARGTGDAALLARVLATATARFPDHPDHGAWRVEQSALSLSPDDPNVGRESAARRWARAIEALDRADRAAVVDQAMRADLAIAAAEAGNEMLRPEDALAVLQRVERAYGDPSVPAGLRERLLEERIAALSNIGRSIEGDRIIRAAIGANAAIAADAGARMLRRIIPADLGTLAATPPDARTRDRAMRLADFVARTAPPEADRDEIVVRALLVAELYDAALPVARRVAAAHGDRIDALLAVAESLWGVGSEAGLAEAMPLYSRIAQGAVPQSPAWWLAELRRLQILDRVNRSTEVIPTKVLRLRSMDPALGGRALASKFLELAARHE